MTGNLEGIVTLVTGSLVLFSSIGLFALTLNARYTHAIGRVREIYEEMQKSHDTTKLAKELNMMVYRCQILKWSFGLLLCSALSSGMFLLGSIFSSFIAHISEEFLILFVVLCVLFIFSSMVFLFLDVLTSLKSTLIHIEKLK